jgi:hypothetical protein
MNVIVDEELLEKARRIADKRTYSDTINFGLSEIVRRHEFQKGLDELQGTNFWEGTVEDLMRMRTDIDLPKQRVAAKTAREPKTRAKRRVSRR